MKTDQGFRVLFALLLMLPVCLPAQTTGNMTFTFSTNSSGGYSPNHLMAIWIENGSGQFVKAKLKRSSNGNLDHLATWTSKSGSNTVDAITGATMTSHGTVKVTWNGTSASGNLVPDGTYILRVEMAWAQSLTTGKTLQSFTFTKGPASFHLAPVATTNFSNISLDWVPGTSSTGEIPVAEPVTVFPNPFSRVLNIDFHQPWGQARIRVVSLTGSVVVDDMYYSDGSSVQTIDLSSEKPGIYFIQIGDDSGKRSFKVVKN